MAKVLDFKSVKPQHIRTAFVDPTTGQAQVLTVYTGQLEIGHGAGGDRSGLNIEYPILGLFEDPAGKGVPGILPFETDVGEFKGAVAMAAMSDFVDKTDPAVWQFRDVHADLCQVNLRPGTKIFAIVLRAVAESEESEVAAVQYQVTVVSNFPRSHLSPLKLADPILVGSPIWDGTYGAIGAVLPLGHGVPNP